MTHRCRASAPPAGSAARIDATQLGMVPTPSGSVNNRCASGRSPILGWGPVGGWHAAYSLGSTPSSYWEQVYGSDIDQQATRRGRAPPATSAGARQPSLPVSIEGRDGWKLLDARRTPSRGTGRRLLPWLMGIRRVPGSGWGEGPALHWLQYSRQELTREPTNSWAVTAA